LKVVEDVEPQADSAAVPVWLFVLLFVLIYWAMIQLDHTAGGFNKFVFGPYHSYTQLADLAPKSGLEMQVAKGEAAYGTLCFSCHQTTGLGNPGQAPPLVGSPWVLGPPERLARIPLNGLTGAIEVNGQVWNLQMPSFKGMPQVDDDETLAALLTYIRQAWGNKGSPVTPEQVKAVRGATTSRASQWTADELLKLP
jgi:mono/diheme cytochrome c family protein